MRGKKSSSATKGHIIRLVARCEVFMMVTLQTGLEAQAKRGSRVLAPSNFMRIIKNEVREFSIQDFVPGNRLPLTETLTSEFGDFFICESGQSVVPHHPFHEWRVVTLCTEYWMSEPIKLQRKIFVPLIGYLCHAHSTSPFSNRLKGISDRTKNSCSLFAIPYFAICLL